MLIPHQYPAIGISQCIRQTAILCTLPSVGTPPTSSSTHIALSTVTYTQCTMYKYLQRYIYSPVYIPYLLQRKFPCQNYLRKTRISQKTNFLHRTIIGLRTRMQSNRRQIQLQKAHILYNQSIRPRIIQLIRNYPCLLQFIITQYRIQCHIHTCPETMGISRQPFDISYTIPRRSPDIHRIRTVVNSLHPDICIFRGRQQLYLTSYRHFISLIS